MISSPIGARLFVASYDYCGSRFSDVTQSAPMMLPPKNSNPSSAAFCESNPNIMIRMGKNFGCYSTDNGINWKTMKSVPASGAEIFGNAISPEPNENGNYVCYASYGGAEFAYSEDFGDTWNFAKGATPMDLGSKWNSSGCIATDYADPNIVYYLTDGGSLYKSEDFGKNFKLITVLKDCRFIKSMFGAKKYLFALSGGSLMYSTSKGELFKTIKTDAFDKVTSFSFGKEKEEGGVATIFVGGFKNDWYGIWMSDDLGVTWKKIYNDETDNDLFTTGVICGDRQEYGVVYAGSSGKGVKYGVPADNNIFYKIRNDEIKVAINGQTVMFDVSPKLINDRTMVPMRKIFEDVGAIIEWDEETETVTASRTVTDNWETKTTVVKLTIGEKKITINGVEQEIDVAPVVIDDRTLVPLRFIAEALGCKVDWNNDRQIAKITI